MKGEETEEGHEAAATEAADTVMEESEVAPQGALIKGEEDDPPGSWIDRIAQIELKAITAADEEDAAIEEDDVHTELEPLSEPIWTTTAIEGEPTPKSNS